MRITMKPLPCIISHRQKTAGSNHHLWNNHGIWWIHYTVHLHDYTVERRRLSLHTRHLATARTLRDRLLSGQTNSSAAA